jgi:DNA (cytosine-5)-methyltransferase 1
MYKIISLFSGCGGLDLGFKNAGFKVIWANEYDSDIWETYQANHLDTFLDKRDIRNIPLDDIPDCDGIIGGPPCQAWSEGGKMLGLRDDRGQRFYDYIRILSLKKPSFFVVENVPGMLMEKHKEAFDNFTQMFIDAGYRLSFSMLNAADFRIPQERNRIFFVGIRNDKGWSFEFPQPYVEEKIILKRAIGDIIEIPNFYVDDKVSEHKSRINHDCYSGIYDSKYMSRNRVRSWNETSFTIQALAKNAPIHPQAPKMDFVNVNKRVFVPGKEHLYRRLSVRECARIQTFPDRFHFIYTNVKAGYKMVGNAVPVRLAHAIAKTMMVQLSQFG